MVRMDDEVVATRSGAEGDVVDLFYLLYPMLDDYQKKTSEAMTALEIVSKYVPEKTAAFLKAAVDQDS